MAEFILTSPTGEKFKITAPDDATDEQVMEFFQKNTGQTKEQPQEAQPQPSGPTPQQPTLAGSALSYMVLPEMASNIPESAGNFFGAIANSIMHPVDTFNGVHSAFRGAIVKSLPKGAVTPYEGMGEDVASAEAVGGFYKNRYGGINNVGKTIVEDPVGAMADVSAGLGLAGGVLRTAGAAKAAKAATELSRTIDPIYQASKAIKGVVKPAYQYGVGMTTGAGKVAVENAMEGGQAFTDAMRGKTSEVEVFNAAKDSLENIKNARSQAYQSRLSGLKNSAQTLNIDDLKVKADSWLDRYGITKTPEGKLDFSRSTLRNNFFAADEVTKVYETVQDWGSKAADTTPIGLDTLKRTIANTYDSRNTSRAMVNDMKKAVERKIVGAVPEYAQMTKDYAKSTELIDSIEHALTTKDRRHVDTALRKMLTAVREDKTYRRALLGELDAAGGQDLLGSISGLMLQPAWSQRLGPMLTSATGLAAGGTAAAVGSFSPLVALIPFASPRVAGEVSRLLGMAGKAAPFGRGAGILAYQSGRLPLQQQ